MSKSSLTSAVLFACLLALSLSRDTTGQERPAINGHAIDPEQYRLLVKHGFLPTRTTFLSNVELAGKFNLTLPHLAGIKAALDKNDAPGLEKALIAYLNSKLPPLKPAKPSKPAPGVNHPEMRYRPDAWIGKDITFNVNGKLKTYPVGDRINWFNIADGEPDFAGWSTWGNILAEAYLATGDPKYAQGLLGYVRAFYKNCRPPAQRTTSWSGALGPWAVGGRGRAMGLLQWLYQVLGGSSVMTDADRTMYLKMIYEHGECMYAFSAEHQVTNFEFYPISVLSLLARTFPEFKESKAWRERAIERVRQNMDDSVLDDGGAQERTQYNGAYLGSYTQFYRALQSEGAPPPAAVRAKLESMYEWFMWVLSPLYQYPSLNISSLSDLSHLVEPAAELFPERADLVYFASKGAKGKPSPRTARVLAHTGFLSMRSDWSRDALFMAMNYNGTLPEIPGTYPDLLSFGLWAHGRAYLTNAGTPVSYAHPQLRDWCTQTKASNTVMIDGVSQHPLANGGRLENWQDRPGFTYLAAASENYRHLGVRHRRAVLFLRPHYWFVFDRLTPFEQLGKVHDYRWQAHFQPMALTVDAVAKAVGSSNVDGKRLYVVPAQPERLQLEQGKGLIADGVHSMEHAVQGPFIRYIQKSDKPVSFTVLMYPSTNNAPAPTLTSLPIQAGKAGVLTGNATGVRIRQGGNEDVIAMADGAGLRHYGPLTTDGEAAYVRTEQGKVVEAGLVAGHTLSYAGQRLLEVGTEIASANLSYAADKITVNVRGHGKVTFAAAGEQALLLNGKVFPAGEKATPKRQWPIEVPDPGPLKLVSPSLSTDATAVYKALVGFRPGPALPPWNPVVVSWKTMIPADTTVDYAPQGSDSWLRIMRPDPVTYHRQVLNRLTAGITYQIRIRSATEDGRMGMTMLTYRSSEPRP